MDLVTALLALILFAFGITIGSFMNVCILRIPAGESIVTAPSHCPKCGKRLKWYELVPLISWLVQGGRCRGCKAKISAQYPIIEAANGLLWVLCALVTGWNALLPFCCAMTSALLVLAVIDGRTQEIPPGINWFILALAAIKLALTALGHVPGDRWHTYVIGLFAISVPLAIVFYATGGAGIGGGDVKLMATAGLFLGWKLALLAFILGCLSGAVIHIARMRLSGAGRQLALGPYLAAGIFVAMLWGQPIITAYLSLFA